MRVPGVSGALAPAMLVVCWNVAGWATTLPKIREHYGTLSSYLDRLGADILCLQARLQRCAPLVAC